MGFIINTDKNRLELHTEDCIAFIDYILNESNVMLDTYRSSERMEGIRRKVFSSVFLGISERQRI